MQAFTCWHCIRDFMVMGVYIVRVVEKKVIEKMRREMENLQADHIRESQELVHQFNEAQDLLKDKLSELQIA